MGSEMCIKRQLPPETAVGKAVLESLRGAPGVDPLTVANDNVSAVMRP